MRRLKTLFCSNLLLTLTGVFLAYSLLTLAMTWPVITQLSTHLIGDGDDMWVHYWNNWWVKRVLQQGGSIFYTPLLFHPTGVSLVHHNFAWVNIALWLLLEPLVGGIAAYNLVHLLHIPLCGLGMFLLARRLTQSNVVAFVSGLVFAFWPYRMSDVNHPNMISTELLPVTMLFLLRLLQDGKPLRDGVIAGLLLALTGYMRWQLLILTGFMTAFCLLYTLIWERERWNWRVVAGLVLAGAAAIMLMTPALFPLIREQVTGGLPDEVYAVKTTDPEQDILAWLIPQHQHPLASFFDRVFPGYGASEVRYRYSAFLGYVAVGLAIMGVVARRERRRTWFWLGLTALCFVLALGSNLWFDGDSYTHIPLPYRLVEWLSPVQMLGPPRRFSALLGLPIAVLAGYGALALDKRLLRQRWGRWLARPVVFVTLLSLLILVDYLSIPTEMVSAQVPAFYTTLASTPDDFALAGLPGKRSNTEHYMFYQTEHGRPVLGGHVSRLPPEALEFMSSIPLFKGMYDDGAIDTSLRDVSRQLSLLSEAGFRYLIIHKALATDHQLDAWRSYFWMSPRYEDEEVVVYTTAPIVGQDFPIQHDLGSDVALIEAKLSVEDVEPGTPLELNVMWGATAPQETNFQLEVSFVNEQGLVGQTERFTISPTWPTSKWSANAIVRDKYSLQIEPWLSDGPQTVTIRLVQAQDGVPGMQAVELGKVTMHAPERSFSTPPMERRVGATFGDDLQLLGYDLESTSDEVYITLHWQALRRMDRSYKFFVHLCAAKTGDLVSQADVVPRGWTHPTSWWEVDEVVSDDIAVPLNDVSPGQYKLWIGVYHPASGERLPVSISSPGFTVREDRLMLPDMVVR